MGIVIKIYLSIVFILNVSFLLSSHPALASSDICSETKLTKTCELANAERKKSCLAHLISDIKKCQKELVNIESEMGNQVSKKGKETIDPLKIEKTLVLIKMQEFEAILAWHQIDIKTIAKDFVDFIKTSEKYKSSEASRYSQLRSLYSRTAKNEDYLQLIQIRFGAQTLVHEERNQSLRIIPIAHSYILKFQEKEKFILEKLLEYKEFIEKNQLKSLIPKYEYEIKLAKSIVDYSIKRLDLIVSRVDDFVLQLTVKIQLMEKKTLLDQQVKDFKLANDISKETEFHKQVSKMLQDAFAISDIKVQGFEYLGYKHRAMEKFLTLSEVCSQESLNNPSHDWLLWGCKSFHENESRARNYLSTQLPKAIKMTLNIIETDKSDKDTGSRKKILDLLNQGQVAMAVDHYDQFLKVVEAAEMSVEMSP